MAGNMSAESYIADAELEKQITALQSAEDPSSQGRALALLTVLLSRCSEDNFSTVAGCVQTLAELATSSLDQLVQVTDCTATICSHCALECAHCDAVPAVVCPDRGAVGGAEICCATCRPMQLRHWQPQVH
jgi:hypothetical protein